MTKIIKKRFQYLVNYLVLLSRVFYVEDYLSASILSGYIQYPFITICLFPG